MEKKEFHYELKPVVLVNDQLIDIKDSDIIENMNSISKQEDFVKTDIENEIPVQNVTHVPDNLPQSLEIKGDVDEYGIPYTTKWCVDVI